MSVEYFRLTAIFTLAGMPFSASSPLFTSVKYAGLFTNFDRSNKVNKTKSVIINDKLNGCEQWNSILTKYVVCV